MATDQADVPDLKLRFRAGRFEDPLVSMIVAIQFSLGAVGIMAGAFNLLAKDGFEAPYLAAFVIPLVIAYLLGFLYE